jgi:hypothetical protein
MHVFHVQLTGPITFLLDPSAVQRVFPVGTHCVLLNPLLTTATAADDAEKSFLTPAGVWLRSRHLAIAVEPTGQREVWVREVLAPMAHRIIASLRVGSRQAAMPRQLASIAIASESLEMAAAAPRVELGEFKGAPMLVRDSEFRTSVTEQHLGSINLEVDVPLHDELLLDALEAYAQDDYRKAILFAAIACESVAKHRARLAHERVSSHDTGNLRGAFDTSKDRVVSASTRTMSSPRSSEGTLADSYMRSLFMRSVAPSSSTHGRSTKTCRGSMRRVTNSRMALFEAARTVLEGAIAFFAWYGARTDFVIPTGLVHPTAPERVIYPGRGGVH